MSTPTATKLSSNARRVAFWLRLFRGGVFEDNYLDVSRLDLDTWERSLTELDNADLITVNPRIQVAGRPYLSLGRTPPPAFPRGVFGDKVRARFVEVYHSFTMPVRQAFHGQKPAYGMEIMDLEEPNFRRAVAWARDLGDTAKMAALADLYAKYLSRAGRTDALEKVGRTWVAGEGRAEVAEAPVDEGEESAEDAVEEAPAPAPDPFARSRAETGTGGRVTAMLRGMLDEPPAPPRASFGARRAATRARPPFTMGDPQRSPPNPPSRRSRQAAPEAPPAPQPPKESEGTRLQREGTARGRGGGHREGDRICTCERCAPSQDAEGHGRRGHDLRALRRDGGGRRPARGGPRLVRAREREALVASPS